MPVRLSHCCGRRTIALMLLANGRSQAQAFLEFLAGVLKSDDEGLPGIFKKTGLRFPGLRKQAFVSRNRRSSGNWISCCAASVGSLVSCRPDLGAVESARFWRGMDRLALLQSYSTAVAAHWSSLCSVTSISHGRRGPSAALTASRRTQCFITATCWISVLQVPSFFTS